MKKNIRGKCITIYKDWKGFKNYRWPTTFASAPKKDEKVEGVAEDVDLKWATVDYIVHGTVEWTDPAMNTTEQVPCVRIVLKQWMKE